MPYSEIIPNTEFLGRKKILIDTYKKLAVDDPVLLCLKNAL